MYKIFLAGCTRGSPDICVPVNDLAVATNVPTWHVCSSHAVPGTSRSSLMDSH